MTTSGRWNAYQSPNPSTPMSDNDLSEKYGAEPLDEMPVMEHPQQDALHSNPELREAYLEGREQGLDYDEALDYAAEKISGDGDVDTAEGSDGDEPKGEERQADHDSSAETGAQNTLADWGR